MPDVVARRRRPPREVVRHAVHAVLELGVGPAPVADDDARVRSGTRSTIASNMSAKLNLVFHRD